MGNQGACVLEHDERTEAEVGYLCDWHRRRMTGLTRRLSEHLSDVVFIAERGTAPKDEVPKTKRIKAAEAPAPADLDVLTLLDARTATWRVHRVYLAEELWPYCDVPTADTSAPMANILAIVAGWVMCVAEERPLTATKLPQSVLAQLDLLERHHDWIAGQAWVDDYMREMDEAGKALKAVLHDRTHTRIGWCPVEREDGAGACRGALLKENGSAVIKCVECEVSWVTAQDQARLSLMLDEQRKKSA